MGLSSLPELLQLEKSLEEAHGLVSSTEQTSLLLSHFELISSQVSSPSCEVSAEEIEKLLQSDGDFNLAQSCNKCHQKLFYNDECASKGELQVDLQPCCYESVERYKHAVSLDVSFWWFLLNSFPCCVMTLPNYTRLMLTHGIPPALRSRIWGLFTLAGNAQDTTDNYMENLYHSLNKDVSPDISIIVKDVNRTFPEISMFAEYSTKTKFENILNAYSIFDSDMGYCQGLQFIVAPLLFHFKDDLKTFNALVKIFELNKLRPIYDHEMSGLHLWFFQFDKIFETEVPELYAHFKDLNIDIQMFLAQWFLSFFSITIPFSFLIRMFDVLLLEGVKSTLFRVGITVLSKNTDLLKTIQDSELIYQHLLSENCWGIFQQDVDLFIDSVMSLPVNHYSSEHLSTLEDVFSKIESKKPKSNRSFMKKMLSSFKTTAESVFSSSSSDDASSTKSSCMIYSNPSHSISQLSIQDDYDLVQSLYKLCLDKGIEDPILERVKMRLYG